MSLRIAVQMDPLESINISGDSTFAIMLGAQQRGYKLYHYLAEDLTWQDGGLYAGAHEVTVQPIAGDHFRKGDFAILDLGKQRYDVSTRGVTKGLATTLVPRDCNDIVRQRIERDRVHRGATRKMVLDCTSCAACCSASATGSSASSTKPTRSSG